MTDQPVGGGAPSSDAALDPSPAAPAGDAGSPANAPAIVGEPAAVVPSAAPPPAADPSAAPRPAADPSSAPPIDPVSATIASSIGAPVATAPASVVPAPVAPASIAPAAGLMPATPEAALPAAPGSPGSIELPAAPGSMEHPTPPAASPPPATPSSTEAGSVPAPPRPARPRLPRKLPLRVAPGGMFLQSREGVRVLIYLVIFVFAGFAVVARHREALDRGRRPRNEDESPFPSVTVRPVYDVPPPKPRAPGSVPFHGLLDNVDDYTPLEPDFAYATLADHVQRLTPEECAKIVEPKVGFQDLLAYPQDRRGSMVRVSGLVIDWKAVRFDAAVKPTTTQGEDAYRAMIVDVGGDECFLVDLAEAPPPLQLRHDLVEVEGAFLKVVRYNNQAGEPRDVPFLLARRLVVIPEERLERPARFDVGMALVAGGLPLLVILYAAFRLLRGNAPGPLAVSLADMRSRWKKKPAAPGTEGA